MAPDHRHPQPPQASPPPTRRRTGLKGRASAPSSAARGPISTRLDAAGSREKDSLASYATATAQTSSALSCRLAWRGAAPGNGRTAAPVSRTQKRSPRTTGAVAAHRSRPRPPGSLRRPVSRLQARTRAQARAVRGWPRWSTGGLGATRRRRSSSPSRDTSSSLPLRGRQKQWSILRVGPATGRCSPPAWRAGHRGGCGAAAGRGRAEPGRQ
jgi:hypothetical protein